MSQILLSFHCRHSSLFQQLITPSTHILKQEFDEKKNLNTNLRTGCETEFFRRVTMQQVGNLYQLSTTLGLALDQISSTLNYELRSYTRPLMCFLPKQKLHENLHHPPLKWIFKSFRKAPKSPFHSNLMNKITINPLF